MKHKINSVVDACFDAEYNAGWRHDEEGMDTRTNPMFFSQKIALIHSELSEALEGDRKDSMDKHLPHRDTREVELADAFIRLTALAGAMNMDLGGAVVEKLAYNASRTDHTKEAREAANGKAY